MRVPRRMNRSMSVPRGLWFASKPSQWFLRSHPNSCSAPSPVPWSRWQLVWILVVVHAERKKWLVSVIYEHHYVCTYNSALSWICPATPVECRAFVETTVPAFQEFRRQLCRLAKSEWLHPELFSSSNHQSADRPHSLVDAHILAIAAESSLVHFFRTLPRDRWLLRRCQTPAWARLWNDVQCSSLDCWCGPAILDIGKFKVVAWAQSQLLYVPD